MIAVLLWIETIAANVGGVPIYVGHFDSFDAKRNRGRQELFRFALRPEERAQLAVKRWWLETNNYCLRGPSYFRLRSVTACCLPASVLTVSAANPISVRDVFIGETTPLLGRRWHERFRRIVSGRIRTKGRRRLPVVYFLQSSRNRVSANPGIVVNWLFLQGNRETTQMMTPIPQREFFIHS